ncbi:hypothetical protein HYT45_03180 [Candidatus Uhrbacteria bacterium]|nr:hypothetical protein [Candidatus Uhrbacteria bacterium]
MDSGEVRIKVPNSSGWSAPQGTSGIAGYTTVSASGNATIANVLNNADSATGWTEDDADACNTTPPTNGFGLDTTTFKEGTGSITCNNSGNNSPDAGDSFGFDFSAQNWSAYTQAGFWIRSTVNTASGDIQAAIDNATNCGSPIEELNIPALTANTWTYVKWTFVGAGSTRTNVRTFCFNAGTNTGMDSLQLYVDDLLIGPGAITFPANGSDTDIAVRLVDMASSETLTTTYGSGGGSSGATAPGTAGSYEFTTRSRTASSGSLTNIASSPTITVTSPATKFVILNPTDGTVDAPITVTVRAEDASGNVDTTYQSDVTLAVSGSAAGGGLVDIVNGIGTKNISDTVAETVNLSLSDTQGTGLNVTSTQDVVFAAGAVAQFALNDPGNMTAGTRLGYTVTRKDQFGNLVTSGATTVYLYSNASGSSDKFYDASSGGNIITSTTIANGSSTANFWYYDELAGSATVTVSDNSSAPDGNAGIDDATDSVTVSAAAVSQFTINDPGNMTAGTRLGYTVTRKDQFNNLVTSGATTVYLYSSASGSSDKFYDASSGGNIITSIAISDSSSSANFWYYDELAGGATITVSDNSSAPDGNTGIDDASDAVTVAAAATSQFLLNDPGNMTVSTRLAYTVTRKDQFNNLVTSGTDTVYLYSSSGSANKAFYNAASGGSVITSIAINNSSSSANFWYFDDTAGTYTITASDNSSAPDGTAGIDDGADSVTVNAAPVVATKFVILNPADGTAGDSISVMVEAQDNSGNVDTTYQSDVTLATSGSATGGGLVDIVDGMGTINITDTVAETVNLSLSDTQGTGLDVTSTQDVVFAVGLVSQFVLNDPGNITAGLRAAYTVTRKDQYGNLASSGNTTVYLYTNSTGGQGAFYDSASGGSTLTSVSIGSGQSSANFWYQEGKAGSWTVSASDNSSAADGTTGVDDGTDAITVSAASVSQFLLDDPGNMTAETRLQYAVTRKDQFGNLVTSGATTVYLYSNSTSANDAFYNASSGGSVITSVSIGSGSSSANFWYFDDTAGTWTITASDNSSAPDGATGISDATDSVTVSSAPITATRFVIINPTDSVVGAAVTVTVKAQDDSGNVDTTYQNDITLVASGSATGGGLVNIANGVGTKEINDNVAETVTLSLSDTASTGLDVSGTQDVVFSPVGAIARGALAEIVVTPAATPTVVFFGNTFPGAKIDLIGQGTGQEIFKQKAVVLSDGSFEIEVKNVPEGFNLFNVKVTDKNGASSNTRIYKIDAALKLLTRISILPPPTLNILRANIRRGDTLTVTGYVSPLSRVEMELDQRRFSDFVKAGSDGFYKFTLNTSNLAYGRHIIKARQIDVAGNPSDLPAGEAFMITRVFAPKTDLNSDGIIDIKDLSIFLTKWRSKDEAVRKQIDFNGDGKVNISDLGIFAQTLKRAKNTK